MIPSPAHSFFHHQQYSVDVGYERFLAPEMFFNPEIYSSDFLTPLPDIVDSTIQSSPIDVRRGLYKVCSRIHALYFIPFVKGFSCRTSCCRVDRQCSSISVNG